MPDDTPLANNIQLSIAKKPPGFNADVLLLRKDTVYNTKSLKKFFLGEEKNTRK